MSDQGERGTRYGERRTGRSLIGPEFHFSTPYSHTRIILETDAAAIAARVSRPKADTTDIVINEETVRNACTSCIQSRGNFS
jgi:hypothetical protein